MTLEQLDFNNAKKIATIKLVATRLADGLVSKNENVTDVLDKNNIEYLVNSSIKSVVEERLK